MSFKLKNRGLVESLTTKENVKIFLGLAGKVLAVTYFEHKRHKKDVQQQTYLRDIITEMSNNKTALTFSFVLIFNISRKHHFKFNFHNRRNCLRSDKGLRLETTAAFLI